MSKSRSHLIQDVLLIIASIAIAVVLSQTGLIRLAVASLHGLSYLGDFCAGLLFTSMFTTAPAIAVLAELSKTGGILPVVLWGALGGLAGDLILFWFVRDRIAADVKYLIGHSKIRRIPAIFRTRLFHRVLPFIGAAIIASPLPDEIGLAMLGLSKMNLRLFAAVSFLMNAAGILMIAWVAGM